MSRHDAALRLSACHSCCARERCPSCNGENRNIHNIRPDDSNWRVGQGNGSSLWPGMKALEVDRRNWTDCREVGTANGCRGSHVVKVARRDIPRTLGSVGSRDRHAPHHSTLVRSRVHDNGHVDLMPRLVLRPAPVMGCRSMSCECQVAGVLALQQVQGSVIDTVGSGRLWTPR